MGASKSEIFTKEQNEMAKIFKALGHPARIAIIEFLVKTESCICGDIVNEISLSQPTTSQHLKELKSAGIIKGNVEGNAICYCIDEVIWMQIKFYFQNLTLQLNQKKCC